MAQAPLPDARHLAARALPALDSRLAHAETLESDDQPLRNAPNAGDLIDGRYRIEKVLGAGGMGVVFGALQLGTERKVALKWMQTRGLHRTASERVSASARFVREAKLAGRIRHPNVVEIYDAGVDPNEPYLVMEWLEGETLRARIDRGALDWDEAVALLVPALRGVMAAHEQGIVHRDLKPDNVFLSRVPSGEIVPKVLDFGISRLHASAEGPEPSLTRTGTMVGTPAYMPLEQLRGEGNVDERTDIYALGVVLYEMLTKSRPYLARNAADFAALIASGAPIPLSRHRPELRGAREALVMKALARAPQDRFANVREMLQIMLAPEEVSHGSPRRSWFIALGLLLLLSLLAWRFRPAPQQELQDVRALPSTPASLSAPSVVRAPPEASAAPAAPVATPEAPAVSVQKTLHPAARPQLHPKSTSTAPPGSATVAPERSSTSMRVDDFTEPAGGAAASPNKTSTPEPARNPSLDLGRDQF